MLMIWTICFFLQGIFNFLIIWNWYRYSSGCIKAYYNIVIYRGSIIWNLKKEQDYFQTKWYSSRPFLSMALSHFTFNSLFFHVCSTVYGAFLRCAWLRHTLRKSFKMTAAPLLQSLLNFTFRFSCQQSKTCSSYQIWTKSFVAENYISVQMLTRSRDGLFHLIHRKLFFAHRAAWHYSE